MTLRQILFVSDWPNNQLLVLPLRVLTVGTDINTAASLAVGLPPYAHICLRLVPILLPSLVVRCSLLLALAFAWVGTISPAFASCTVFAIR